MPVCLTGEVNKQGSNTIHHKYIRSLLILYLALVGFFFIHRQTWSDRANPKTNNRFWVCFAHHVPYSLVKTVQSHFRIHISSQFTVEVGVFTGNACHGFFCLFLYYIPTLHETKINGYQMGVVENEKCKEEHFL